MKYKLLILLILCATLLAGCGCDHQWQDATCTAPLTCALCGETEGESVGHSWTDATCETPKTCSTCGEAEGEPLAHSWTNATCEAPKTCSGCDKTEGEPLAHTFGEWAAVDAETEERTCSACGYAEQQTVDHLATLAELLPTRWINTYVYADGEVYLGDEENYVGVFLIEEDILVGAGIYEGYYFDTGAIEVLSYDSALGLYLFINELYPSYIYGLQETNGAYQLSLIIDENLVFFYEKEY